MRQKLVTNNGKAFRSGIEYVAVSDYAELFVIKFFDPHTFAIQADFRGYCYNLPMKLHNAILDTFIFIGEL